MAFEWTKNYALAFESPFGHTQKKDWTREWNCGIFEGLLRERPKVLVNT